MRKPFFFAAAAYLALRFLFLAAGIAGDCGGEAERRALAFFTPEEISAGRAYFLWGLVPSTAYHLALFGVLVALAARASAIFSRVSAAAGGGVRGVLFSAAVFAFAVEVLRFPFAVVSGFYKNKLFGLMNAPFALWSARYWLDALLGIGVLAVVAVFLSWIDGARRRALALVPAIAFPVMLGFGLLYPALYVPLVYEVRNLESGALKTGIEELLGREGFSGADIRVVGSSRYSGHANALFTGFGGNRVIYLYDTMLDEFTGDEILAVIAHELCHYREEHVLIGTAAWSLALPLVIMALSALCSLFYGCGFAQLMKRGRIAEAFVAAVILLFALRPVESAASRFLERRADRHVIAAGIDRAAAIGLEVKLARKNRAHILPHPLYAFWFYSHPPVMERIRLVE